MHTLRRRLIISHILPLLIVTPLVGITLIYLLETQVLLANLSDQLTRQAVLAAEFAAQQPGIWQDSQQAQAFVRRARTELRLIAPDGRLVASNAPGESDQPGQPLNLPPLTDQNQVQVGYNQLWQAEVVEVYVPVIGPNRQVIGFIGLTEVLADVNSQFGLMRQLILGSLVAQLVVGIILGLTLALNLERPIRQVTQAVYDIASGRQWTVLPEQGPTEIRLLARSFNTLIERLRVLEEARQRLLANIVHEVGRPIGAVQSAIQALINGADEEPALRRELLEGMAAEVNRLHPLLDNLTNLHGQVLGTLELNFQPIGLSDWLPRTIAPWREAAQAKGLHWRADIPLALPTLELDPDRMAQVVGNLLSNTVKYTPSGGTVMVSAGVEGDTAWIQVSDTGPGLSAEEQAHIFEPFYRSQPGRRFPQGLGLGLTIAQDMVKAHGGQLEVDSQPGQGSRFTIYLPQK